MKKIMIIASTFLLLAIISSCGKKIYTTVDSNSTQESTIQSTEATTNNATTNTPTYTEGTATTYENTTQAITTTQNTTAQSTTSTTNQITNKPITNPDGSTRLSAPTVKHDISDYTEFSFKDSLPDGFLYIDGNNAYKTTDFYKDSYGGLIMDENVKGKKGFQSCLIDSYKKIEIRINIGKFHGTMKQEVRNVPVITVYGFDINGNIIDTQTIDDIDKNKEGNYVRVYLRGEAIAYFEVRATNLPYQSSQVYNFGIRGVTIKGWQYE